MHEVSEAVDTHEVGLRRQRDRLPQQVSALGSRSRRCLHLRERDKAPEEDVVDRGRFLAPPGKPIRVVVAPLFVENVRQQPAIVERSSFRRSPPR